MKRSISKKSLAALAVPLALLYLRRSHSKRKSEAAKKRTAPRLLGGALGSFLAGGVAGYGVGRRRPDVGRAVNDSEARTDDLSGAHDGETPTAGYISDAIQQTLGSLPGRRKKKRKNARILRRPTTRVGRHGSQYDSDNNSSWSTKWAETRQQMTLPTPPMYRRRRRIIEKLRDVARNTVYFDLSGEDTEPVSEYETDWAAMIGARRICACGRHRAFPGGWSSLRPESMCVCLLAELSVSCGWSVLRCPRMSNASPATSILRL